MFVRGDTMKSLRIFVLTLLPILALTVETAPAGSQAPGAQSPGCIRASICQKETWFGKQRHPTAGASRNIGALKRSKISAHET